MSVDLLRMKQLVVILLAAGLFACQKKIARQIEPSDLMAQAQEFFNQQVAAGGPALSYRAAQPKKPLWTAARVISYGQSKAVSVPILYDSAIIMSSNMSPNLRYHLDYLTQLVVYADSTSQLHAVTVTSFPDSNFFADPTKPFTGLQFVEDWQGHSIEKLQYRSDGSVYQYEARTKEADDFIIETCATIYGYNYSEDDPLDQYQWSEPGGCDFEYVGGSGGGSGGSYTGGLPGGGGSSAGSPATVMIAPPTNIIGSVPNYLQCFTNVGGSDHKYTVTVCVDQPDPGQRTPWAFSSGGSSGSSAAGNLFNVGHTFLILTETSASNTITRNIGFYPSTTVNPSSPSAPGAFNNDSNHPYNISGTFTIDNSQFFNILNFIVNSSTSGATYNLNSNNCTTFDLNALSQGGINLPRTIGTWPGGAGDNPGDLGQDLRIGFSGMAVNTLPNAGHPNLAVCNLN